LASTTNAAAPSSSAVLEAAGVAVCRPCAARSSVSSAPQAEGLTALLGMELHDTLLLRSQQNVT
jgi:hypothetical protein